MKKNNKCLRCDKKIVKDTYNRLCKNCKKYSKESEDNYNSGEQQDKIKEESHRELVNFWNPKHKLLK